MKNSTALLVLAQFAHTGAKLVLFIFLTQLGGFETAGAYTYGLAIVTPTFLLFGFSLRQIFVTSRAEVNITSFLFLRCVYGALGFIVVLIIALLIRPEMFALFAAMAGYRFVESLVDIRIADFQRSSRVGLMALATLLLAFLTTGIVAIAFAASEDLTLSIVIGSFTGFLLFILLPAFMPNRATGRTHRSLTLREAGKISRNGLFLSLSTFLVSLGASVPVLILGGSNDDSAVGAYSSIAYLSAISNILFSAVSQAELRVFAKLAAEGSFSTFLKRAKTFSLSLSGIGLLAAIPMYFFGADIFSYVFGQDFSDYQGALMTTVLTICLAPFSFFQDVQLVALQKFSIQTVISTGTLAFSVTVGLVLIPLLSIWGATLTVLLTMFLRIIIKGVAIHRIITKPV